MSLPQPFPSGWYCVGFSSELATREIARRRFMGSDAVLFRTATGALSLMDAYCPHLGSHLGQGSVEGESIQCSFHHFRFDCAGSCVATGYGGRPPSIRVRTWPVEEKNGLILAYHGESSPSFQVPMLDDAQWTPLRSRVFRQRGHPQETTENSVDLGHFARLHGFADVQELRPADTSGPYLNAKYSMRKPIKLGRFGLRGVDIVIEVSAHGLGYSVVETLLPAADVRLRYFILASPTEADEIELRVAMSMAPHRMPLASRVVPILAFRSFIQDVSQDLVNWQAKRYVPRPILVEGDGPIRLFRRWAEQFYAKAPE